MRVSHKPLHRKSNVLYDAHSSALGFIGAKITHKNTQQHRRQQQLTNSDQIATEPILYNAHIFFVCMQTKASPKNGNIYPN